MTSNVSPYNEVNSRRMEHVRRLGELIRYIIALQPQESFSERIPEKDKLLDSGSLAGLPGVSFPLQEGTGEAWVRLERIQPSAPPAVPQDLAPWVVVEDQPGKAPIPPTLRKRIDNPAAGKPKRKGKGKAAEAVVEIQETDSGEDDGSPAYLWLRNFPDIEPAFNEWMKTWEDWARQERPRRQSAAAYERLYRIFRDLTTEGMGDSREVVCGVAHALWRHREHTGGEAYSYPLILQRCEVRMLDDFASSLEILPSGLPPVLHLGRLAAGPGGEGAEAFWKARGNAEPISPFDPSSYAQLAAGLAARLDASGSFHESWEQTELPEPNERLTVVPWVTFFHKKRSHSSLIADLVKLEQAIEHAQELPEFLINLVDRDSVQALPEELPHFRGLENFGNTNKPGAKDLFFPLPYNEEQVQVAQRLEVSPGVVVQGPPGTGKSHTIANVVSHYLAEGKRVLVTAHSAAALAAVREKIPKSIRDLTAALLTSETDSLADFEKSVREIADRLATFQPDAARRAIEDLTNRVNGLYARQAQIDDALLNHMRPHHALHVLNGQPATLMDLARFHIHNEGGGSWWGRVPAAAENPGTNGRVFPTIPADLNEALIAQLRQARLDAGSLFPRLFEPVSNPDSWPQEDEIRSAIEANRRLANLKKQVEEGVAKCKTSPLAETAIWELNQDIERLGPAIAELQRAQAEADALDDRVRYPARPDEPILGEDERATQDAASAFCAQVISMREQLRQQIGRIQLPAGSLWDADFRQAVERGAQGDAPLGGFFQKMRASRQLKDWIDSVYVDGAKVSGKAGWELVSEHIKTLDRAAHVEEDWVRHAVAFGWDGVGQSTSTAMVQVKEEKPGVEALFRAVSEVAAKADRQKARSVWRRKIAPSIERALAEIFVNPMANHQSGPTKSRWARGVEQETFCLRPRAGATVEQEAKPRMVSPWANWDQMTDGQREIVLGIAERSLNLWQAIEQEQKFLDVFKQQANELIEEARPVASLDPLPPLPVPPRTRQTVPPKELTMMDRVRAFLETEMWEESSASSSSMRPARFGGLTVDTIEARITKWRTLLTGMERLYTATRLAAKPAAEGLNKLIAMGLGDWVHSLIKQPLDNLPNSRRVGAALPDDPLLPEDWRERLTKAQVHSFLVDLDTSRALANLFEERRAVVESLAYHLRELVAERAWEGLAKGVTPRQRQALGAYLSAVRAVGSGTGKRSARHQQDARAAMSEAFSAVPCWIMPTSRVSETMPSEIGLFDLVVIDEASQSDISALPALMRGKKVLVVGDDKQVSPSNFVQEEVILQQRRTLLASQPFAPLMAPDRSLYDLFSGILPNASIMLREHFRCVESIISWSNFHYYHNKMIPLRMPAAAERLDPPLVDILVEDGKLEDDVNIPEARVIANEIVRIVNDPKMANKSIGVVTLPSKEAQSLKIKEMIDQAIPHTAYLRHKILVGPPARFQGSERDIMFVAMTWDGNGGGASDKPEFHQRFNVAMSRARDRMILVRSIPDSAVRGGTLMANVIHHFQEDTTMKRGECHGRERCQTDLEREVFDALSARGYRVQSQVGPRHARIDLVAEDSKGHRLAIECDGDLPATSLGGGDSWMSLWKATTARQRVLERAGWTFFRVVAAGWYLDPEGTMEKLLAALEHAGVQTSSHDELDSSRNVWVMKIRTRSEPEVAQQNTVSEEKALGGQIYDRISRLRRRLQAGG